MNMATPKENSHRIQEYLDGEMPDADRYQFEQDCAKDKSLAAI
jgi:anti-sigma factor RsiW